MDRKRPGLPWAWLLLSAVASVGCAPRQGIWPAYGVAVTAADRQRIHAALGVTCRPWKETGWDGWELISAHWRIRTTVRDEYLLTYMPLLLEDAVEEYRRVLETDRQPGEPMRGYLFSDKREWMAFTRSYAPEIASVTDRITAGGYQYKGTYISFHIGRGGTLANAAHEGLHLFWERTFATPIPAWLNEGLAVQFEGSTRRDGRLVVDLEHNLTRTANLQYALVHKDTLPLATLIATHPGEVISARRNNWRAYYGEVWALIRFMRDGGGGAYRPVLRQIVADCKLGRYRIDSDLRPGAGDTVEAFKQRVAAEALGRFTAYLPVPFEQFEREYWAFARALAGIHAGT